MSVLLRLRWMRLRRRAGREAGGLAIYFDFWSIVHYLFAGMAFGPGIYYYWAYPPALPPGGRALLAFWPLFAVVIGWGWALLGGVFGPAAASPLPLSRADVHLLLTSPVSRGQVLLERFVTGWARRAFAPVGLVVVVAVLTNGYHLVPWTQVGWLALTCALLALGTSGLSVAVFALGPGVRRWLGWVRHGGQVAALGLTGLAVLVRPPVGAAPSLASLEVVGAPALAGFVLPALLFALGAVALAWFIGGRRELTTWTDDLPAEADRVRRESSTPGGLAGLHIFRWKQRVIWRKRSVWTWVTRFVAPAVGAALTGVMAGRVGVVIAGVMSALALYQAARYLAAPLAEEVRGLDRLRRLPVRLRTFLAGSLLEVGLWLLPPTLLAWLAWGAGWLALPGAVLTVAVLAVLSLQHLWAERVAALSVKAGPSDTAFPYVALTALVVGGEALVRYLGPEGLLLAALIAGGGAAFVLSQVYWDMLTA